MFVYKQQRILKFENLSQKNFTESQVITMNKLNETSSSISSTIPIPLICAFHPNQVITNFCVNPSCLLPMCPVCVAIHSEQHREQKTHGQFESIQQVIGKISTLLLSVNKSLQDLSQEYTEDYWNKEKLLQSCKQILNNHKKKFIKEIDRKFQQIEYKLTRKINEFQDDLHDKYKQLQVEIQYLYDSVNKQREEIVLSNQRILKNVICFYSQKKQEKMKQWQGKFKSQVNGLKKQSIRIKCNEELFDLVKSIEYFFTVENFLDDANEYLVSSARELLSSTDTKRKRLQSPRWAPPEDDRKNIYIARNNTSSTTKKYTIEPYQTSMNNSVLSGNQGYSSDHERQWSASKL